MASHSLGDGGQTGLSEDLLGCRVGKARAEWEAQEAGQSDWGVRPVAAAVEHASTAPHPHKFWQSSPLPFSLCLLPFSLCLLQGPSLWASSLQGHPSLHWLLRDWEGRRAFFLLNKDFLVDTLTCPVVFWEGLQRQLLGSPLSPVAPDTATHSQELDPKQACPMLSSV